MKILGLNGWTERGHDGGASLLIDGKLVFAIEEERLTRVRHAYDSKPILSISEILKQTSLTLDDIDIFSIGWDYEGLYKIIGKRFISKEEMSFELFGDIKYANKIVYIPHHISHAFSVYYTSRMVDALVIVLDGQGEYLGTSLYLAKEKSLKMLMGSAVSLGYFYTAVTKHCGMNSGEEGKTMGLASYGNPLYLDRLREFINYDGNRIKCCFSVKKEGKDEESKSLELWSELLSSILPKRTGRIEAIDEKILPYANLANSAQLLLEEVVTSIISDYAQKYNIKSICLAGGVALNCQLASKIESLPFIDYVYTQPAANDGGVSLGAAIKSALDYNENISVQMNPYLGTSYSDEYIYMCLNSFGYVINKYTDVEFQVAKLLSKGNIVAFFQGRAEFGPRALGNRSLLASPSDYDMLNKLNTLKGREVWRPLAPAVLYDFQESIFGSKSFSPYMTKNFIVNYKYRKLIPAITHVDNTARVQSVTTELNDRFYRVIYEFYKLTGIPLIINTSFNVKGEPIVLTPIDAIYAFEEIKADYLCIGSYIVQNRKKGM